MAFTTEEPIDLLFDKYFSVLVLYAKRFVSSYAVAEDIVQETFLSLWEREYSGRYSKAYLFTCVHNRAVNYIKRSKVGVEIKDVNLSVSPEVEVKEDVLEEYERLRSLFIALDKLPPKTLEVLKNIYLEEKNYSAVSAEMGMPLNTVKAHMYMAFKLLRKYMLLLWVYIDVYYYIIISKF